MLPAARVRRLDIRSAAPLWILSATLTILPALRAANVAIAPGLSVPVERGGGPRHVILPLLDPVSGDRIARLEIQRTALEYRHHGVFRVAWDPVVVLDGVDLEITDLAAWPAVRDQLPPFIHSLSGDNPVELRAVRIHVLDSSPRTILADSARFTPAGDLRLVGFRETPSASGAPASSPIPTPVVLHLSGADLGRVESAP